MKRRKFLLALGAVAAVPLTPYLAMQAWQSVALHAPAGALTADELALVSALADTLIPRTDIPGATDLGVERWIDLVVARHFAATERTLLLGGLVAIDALALDTNGVSFAGGSASQRERVVEILDRPSAYERFATRVTRSRRIARAVGHVVGEDIGAYAMGLPARRARAYVQIKELVVHGYFTSEHVHNEVLGAASMPGHFDGAAPHEVDGS